MKKIIADIVTQIEKADKIALFGHKNADGDSISSSYGFAHALREFYPKKEIIWVTEKSYYPLNYPSFPIDYSIIGEVVSSDFLTIACDGALNSRIERFEQFEKGYFKICIDHHQNDVNFPVDIFWHEPTCHSAAWQVCQIIKEIYGKTRISSRSALALVIGILTDTGWFSYSLIDSWPIETYLYFLKFITKDDLNNYINASNQKTDKDIKVQKILLEKLQYHGKVSFVVLDFRLVQEYGINAFKFKLPNIGNIKDKPIWVAFMEKEPESEFKYEVHLRSNGPNVNMVAQKFGGGGHIRTSGAKIKDDSELYLMLELLNQI